MKQIITEICSCGFGLASAEVGKKVKGLSDHFRQFESQRANHHQQTYEVWSS